MFLRMQRQLMDLTNFSEGTILDNIININEEMAKKLKLKVDLRTETLLENTEATKTDLQALEDKMDYYIVEFVALNRKNEDILQEAYLKNDENFKDKTHLFEQKLNQHLEKLEINRVDDDKLKK